ncbi:MAG: phage tail protein [Roseovarius sp.]|nr:phage tail protein [Roseovarius sp.]MBD12433.1 phage tail protein [Roseovarius sp.]
MDFVRRSAFICTLVFGLAAGGSLVPESAKAGTDPFIGDIIAVGYSFCPRGWMSAEGQILPISSNTALFALIGTTYGGNGTSTFGLPDLRGRGAMGQGTGPGLTPRVQGQMTGAEAVTLSINQMPSHSHAVNANNLDGDLPGPGGKLLAAAPPSGVGSETIYSDKDANVTMSSAMIGASGQSQAFNVEDPTLVMRYCIAIQGVFPPRN